MLHKIKIGWLVVMVGLLIALAASNLEPIDLNLLLTTIRISTALLVFLAASLGVLSGCLLTGLWMRRRSKRAKESQSENTAT